MHTTKKELLINKEIAIPTAIQNNANPHILRILITFIRIIIIKYAKLYGFITRDYSLLMRSSISTSSSFFPVNLLTKSGTISNIFVIIS